MSVQPTLHETRIFATTGKIPESLKKRREEYARKCAAEKAKEGTASKLEDPSDKKDKDQNDEALSEIKVRGDAEPDQEDPAAYPIHTHAGWYELSNGDKVRGKKAAEMAQAKLDKTGG